MAFVPVFVGRRCRATPSLQGRLDEGSFKGSGSLDITKSEPQYKLRGQARNLMWKTGRVDLEGEIQTLVPASNCC